MLTKRTKILIILGYIAWGIFGIEIGMMIKGNSQNPVVAPSVQHSENLNTPPSTNDAATSKTLQNGLQPAKVAWVSGILHDSVYNSQGKLVSLSKYKAILLVAPWCPYCHETLQLLNQEHLLSQVTVVNLDIKHQEGGPDLTVSSVAQAAAIVKKDLAPLKLSVSANVMLYAMPNSMIDRAVQEFPVLLVQHQGVWYIHNGAVSDSQFWENVVQ